MDGYPGGEDRFADSIAMDCLLKAAANKDAALHVMDQRPRNLESTLDMLKIVIHNQERIYGAVNPKVSALIVVSSLF